MRTVCAPERGTFTVADEQGLAHEPVMVGRIVELLAVPSGAGVLVDATIGAAGHAAALLAASSPDVHLVGFDRDPDALAMAGRRLAVHVDRVHLIHDGYDRLTHHVAPLVREVGPVLGVLYDLGVSSMQLDRGERGFSLRTDAPLDMRMDPTRGQTAADLVNNLTREDLRRILREYGEERFAGRIAEAIVGARPVDTTGALAALIAAAVPAAARRGAIHPATRSFQALRIAVNAELDRFSASLPQALELAAPAAHGGDSISGRGGRIAVLSYHSLEDRIAKQVFRDAAAGCVCPPGLPVCGCGREPVIRHLTRGAERPSSDEVIQNTRARPAKLRAAEKL